MIVALFIFINLESLLSLTADRYRKRNSLAKKEGRLRF